MRILERIAEMRTEAARRRRVRAVGRMRAAACAPGHFRERALDMGELHGRLRAAAGMAGLGEGRRAALWKRHKRAFKKMLWHLGKDAEGYCTLDGTRGHGRRQAWTGRNTGR